MKKKIIICFIVSLLLIVLSIVCSIRSNALEVGVSTMSEWASSTYNEMITYNFTLTTEGGPEWNYTRQDEVNRASATLRQMVCLEKSEGHGQGYPKTLWKLMDINGSASGSEAKIAFIAWAAEKDALSYLKKPYHTYKKYYMAFREAIREIGISSYGGGGTYISENPVWIAACEYASSGSWTSPSGETVSNIKARVLFFRGTGTQDCALVYGEASEGNVKIDKYITQTQNSKGTNSPDQDRSNKADSWKESNAVTVNEKGTEITYKIVITNEGSSEVTVKYTDDYSDGGVFTHISGDTFKTIRLAPNASEEITLVLKYDADKSSGKYKNKAIIETESDEPIDDSSDWITVKEEPKITLDKYVTYAESTEGEGVEPAEYDENGNEEVPEFKVEQAAFESDLGDGRADMTDEEKEADPVSVGYNIGTKTVKYKIHIKNEGESNVTGQLTDICELNGFSGYNARDLDEPSFNPGSTGSLTIKPGHTVEVVATKSPVEYATAHLYEGCNSGKYRNKAVFRVGEYEWESSDWVIVDDWQIQWGATLTKEATYVEDPDPAVERAYSGRSDKDRDPVEVTQGSIVTFKLTATNLTNYRNKSERNHAKKKHPDVNKIEADMAFYDIYDTSQFKLISTSVPYTGEEGALKFQFYNIPINNTAEVEIKLQVLVDNMYLPNIYNYAEGVELHVTRHHYYDYDVPVRTDPVDLGHAYTLDEDGNRNYLYDSDGNEIHWWGTHDVYAWDEPENYAPDASCRWGDSPTEHYGEVECHDYDCARVLDPKVGGLVFWDSNKDGFYQAGGEEIGKANNGEEDPNYYLEYAGDYQDITVELWDAVKNIMVGDPIPIDSNGNFSFGRVRKGYDKDGTLWTQGEDFRFIGEGNHFKYTSESRCYYYIVFNYNGLKYEATIDSADSHLYSDHTMQSPLFETDSNAHEINRDEFNKKFETIANDKAFPNTTGEGDYIELEYEEKGRNLQKSFLSRGNEDTNIKAQSFRIFYESGDVEYLKYINLGLILRPQGDMSSTKDFVQAEVTINGYKSIYTYDQLGKGVYKAEVNNTLAKPYILRVYREDYEFRTANYDGNIQSIKNAQNPYTDFGRTNDLEIILTYKITAKNESGNADAVIREVMDYYIADEMEYIENGAWVDSNGNQVKDEGEGLTLNTESQYANTSHAGSGYGTVYVRGTNLNKKLGENDTVSFYIMYKVKKDGAGYIKKDALSGDPGKENVAEIGAFSLYKPGTYEPAGMVDGDSNPGNANPTDEPNCGDFVMPGAEDLHKKEEGHTYFEDDTFKTTALVILRDEDGENDKMKQDYRNISGIVFEEIKKDILADEQLVGDSKMNYLEKDDATGKWKSSGLNIDSYYKLNDIPANNVLVKLYEVVQDNGKEYYIDTGMWYRTWVDMPEKDEDKENTTKLESGASNPRNGRFYFGDGIGSSVRMLDDGTPGESLDDNTRLHPGVYTVRFIYGDNKDYFVTTDGNLIRYSGQDYQSTKYTDILDTPGITSEEIVGTSSDNELKIVKATVFDKLSKDGSSEEPEAFFKTVTYTDSNGVTHTENDTTIGKNIYSLAKDNEIRRLEVNSYSTTTTYVMDKTLKANNRLGLVDPSTADATEEEKKKLPKYPGTITDIVQETTLLAEHTAMYADSKLFEMDIEYYDNYELELIANPDGSTTQSRENHKMSGLLPVEKYYHSVRSVNFGITERPETKLQLMDDIIEIEAISSDGNTLVDLMLDVIYEPVYDEETGVLTRIDHKSVVNYEKSKEARQVQVLNRKDTNQGFRYVNIDTDILQGMVVVTKYRIAIANISQVDHISKDLQDKMIKTVEELAREGSADKPTLTDIDVVYDEKISEPGVEYTNNLITDSINILRSTGEIRSQNTTYNYENNYLYDLVSGLKSSAENNTEYKGSTLSGASEMLKKTYTYSNIKALNSAYKVGYYLGNIYYKGEYTGKEAKVQTKVDQFISYVDTDIVFKPEENLLEINEDDMKAGIDGMINKNTGKEDQLKYLTYTTKEISEKGLLKDVIYDVKYDALGNIIEEHDPIKQISDGQKDYYNEDKPNVNNNLAFNIEKEGVIINNYKNKEITLGTYKYMEPINKDEAFKPIADIEHTIPGKPGSDDGSGNEYYDYDNEGANRSKYNSKTIYSIGNPYYDKDKTGNSYYAYEGLSDDQRYDYNREINRWLYIMELQATKILSSEMDVEGLIIDNLAEILKATSTAGRKVYVLASKDVIKDAKVPEEYKTGYLGNTTKEPIEINNDNRSPEVKKFFTSLVTVALNDTDTDFTEFITFSPPTGLTVEEVIVKNWAENPALIIIPVIVIIVGSIYVIVQFMKRKKFYK